jgi:hypothetical protein
MADTKEIRLDQILGRQLLGGNNQPIGRIEEVRANRHGNGCSVVEVVVGMSGMFERLDLGARMLVGASKQARVARWDQIDFSNPEKPRLTVPVEELSTT